MPSHEKQQKEKKKENFFVSFLAVPKIASIISTGKKRIKKMKKNGNKNFILTNSELF